MLCNVYSPNPPIPLSQPDFSLPISQWQGEDSGKKLCINEGHPNKLYYHGNTLT